MGLPETVTAVLATARKLQDAKRGNEANTKALLIERILKTLGWNTEDLDAVEREVKVYDGTFLDYALLMPSGTKLYVEAKGLSGNLDDKKFIAQTVNYANNEGVVWCVLTNGLRYRVYKTNEPVPMDQKLLFEVDLGDESQPLAERVRQLRALSRDAVANGTLDALGERTFTDSRVRQALSGLASDPPTELVEMVQRRVEHPPIPTDQLQRSLARVLDAPTPNPASHAAAPPSAKVKPVGPPTPPKGTEYSLEHHLGNKSTLIRELFEGVDKHAETLAGDVTRRVRKQYVGYFRGKQSFVTVEIQRSRLLIFLGLDPTSANPWDAQVMRDVSAIGHFGMGNLEFSLTSPEQLPQVGLLIQAAYAQKA